MVFDEGAKLLQVLLHLVLVMDKLLQIMSKVLGRKGYFILTKSILNLFNHRQAAEYIFELRNGKLFNWSDSTWLIPACIHGCAPKRFLKVNVVLFNCEQVIAVA